MTNDLTLVIMAAGKGSRYGGSKQTDSLGLMGESIMDFSIYDACMAGFNNIIFIIQKDKLNYFKDKYRHLSQKYDVQYVVQDVQNIPFESNGSARIKPWGTTHACWSARKFITTPFCILNADDYYGRSTFFKIAAFLKNNENPDHGVFVAYQLRKTISEHGSVSRGICTIHDGELKSIRELLSIELINNVIIAEEKELNPNTPVSMNIWGFNPKVIELLDSQLNIFGENLSQEERLTKEALLPADIQSLIDQNLLVVNTLYADEEWFGITYQKDKEFVSKKLREMQTCGYYPSNLMNL